MDCSTVDILWLSEEWHFLTIAKIGHDFRRNWIYHQWINVSIKSCHIYHEDKIGYVVFVQNDQIWFFSNKKVLSLDQICPK